MHCTAYVISVVTEIINVIANHDDVNIILQEWCNYSLKFPTKIMPNNDESIMKFL